MARLTRKDLKTDKFALEVGQTVDYFEEHRKDIIRYGAIALVVVLIGAAVFFYRKQQHTTRQEALGQAIQMQEASVGQAAPGMMSFPTQQAKDQATLKAFGDLAGKYSGSDEALIAEYYLGSITADQGKLAEATKHYKAVVDSGDAHYAPLAKLSLAQIYFSDGHAAEGEQLLRSMIDHPTLFVSKEQATMVLAQELAKTKPDEARKLLGPLRTSSGPVSQIAIRLYGELLPN